MAFVDPILIPTSQENDWSKQISDIFNNQLETKQEIPLVSIFLVPELIKKEKPEAYEPQQIGLGPNYHFKPWPYRKMEQRKLTSARRVLEHCKIKPEDFKKKVRDKVYNRICDIRGCYDMFLQDEDYFLAWLLTIDGLFLLYLFHSYNSPGDHDLDEDEVKRKRLFAQDLIMVENQIPFTVLKEISIALDLSSSGTNSIHLNENCAGKLFRSFCETHSPLELCSRAQGPTHVEHLLDYMYDSIVNNIVPLNNNGSQGLQIIVGQPGNQTRAPQPKKDTADLSLPNVNFGHPAFKFAQKFPWKQLAPLYEQSVTTLEAFAKNGTDMIYSASKLHGAGFKFHILPIEKGIWEIEIDKKEIHLRRLTLNSDSEVILRNLAVYEMLTVNSDNYPMIEYLGLMCGLIQDVNDIKLLKREKIIEGELREGEAVKLFTGMNTSISAMMKTSKKSRLQEKIVEVNTAYESKARMWYVLVRKLAIWMLHVLKAIGNFAETSLKIVAFLISLITVFLLTSQAYCDAYGCSKTNVSLLTYAPFSHTSKSI